MRPLIRLSATVSTALAGLLLRPPVEAETRRVIAGRESYRASGFHELWFGAGYRALWTTPIEVPLLDLRTFAGGLAPVRQVGSLQSLGLAMKGADGRSYTFRLLDKDPTKILPPEWRESWPAKIFQDQTIAGHPGTPFVLPPLAEAAGVPHTDPQVVFMPDDPALGTFQRTFGGKPGTIDEYPTPRADGYAGFLRANEIVSTGEIWKRWLEGHVPIDIPVYLRARMFDLVIGDWDRHNGQWRFLRREGHEAWLPLPEDRDQAFSDFSGVMLGMARQAMPRLLKWEDDYSNLPGLVFQGAETDRWFLAGTERAAFERAAREVRDGLTDEVIQAAVRRLPPEWHALGGDRLARDLMRRRDLLPAAAQRFYEHLAREVDVRGTDAPDLVRLEWQRDGDLVVEVRAEAGAAPWFRRRFRRRETREVRLYLHGGADRLTTTGPRGDITVRVSGGAGADVLDDSASGGTRFYDAERAEVTRGSGTSVSTRHWEPRPHKPETPWLESRDYGAASRHQLLAWWEPDPGLVLAAGKTFYRYGFRKQPYAQVHRFGVGFETARRAFKVTYDGEYRWSKPGRSSALELEYDGAKNYNFFDFGNETAAAGPGDFHRSHQRQFSAFPALAALEDEAGTLRLRAGPEVKYSSAFSSEDTLLSRTRPYGFGDFGQVGARVRFDWDTRRRGPKRAPGAYFVSGGPRQTGVRLGFDGGVYPKAWDVEETFGAVDASLAGSWGVSSRLTLAARVGGRRLWGRYPWHEAAFIGGGDTVRGYERNRWAGDASVYANAEARLGLGTTSFILPARWGVLALADAGRVFVDGETSNTWRPAWGGGLWFRLLHLDTTFYVAAVKGRDAEKPRIYASYGFAF
ncbi:MAG TPA: hypothetical protein VMT87_17500 [Vicinamibacteria bacterium]|nr:hypothetical protein [Vicinamibacteria bacterium]